MSDTVSRVQQRERPADHDGGVLVRRHQDMRAHRSRRGLSVGAGDADRVRVIAGDRTPGLSPLEDRDIHGSRLDDLGVFIPHGRCPHDEIRIGRDILRPVADFDVDALSASEDMETPPIPIRYPLRPGDM